MMDLTMVGVMRKWEAERTRERERVAGIMDDKVRGVIEANMQRELVGDAIVATGSSRFYLDQPRSGDDA
jgi:hypothetical protein